MPTISQIGLPIPVTGEEFEDIVRDCLSVIFGIPFQKIGVPGQKQFGLDLYSGNIGVQCKRYKNTQLTTTILEKDIQQVEKNYPTIEKLIIATTYPRDVKIQQYVINRQGIQIEIYYWDIFETVLLQNMSIKELHYPKKNEDIPTKQFINRFLSLCHKYNVYEMLTNDYFVPFLERIYGNQDVFFEEVTMLINSDHSLNVNKVVLQEIAEFRDCLFNLVDVSSLHTVSNGGGIAIPTYFHDEVEKYWEEYKQKLLVLNRIYDKYKFGL